MTIIVDLLTASELPEYSHLAENSAGGMIYHQLEYISAIREIINPHSVHFIGARRENNLIAGTVLFEGNSTDYKILNSLPYFGSHGDIIASDNESGIEAAPKIARFLKHYKPFQDASTINMVENPIHSWLENIAPDLSLTAWDTRIGQISVLPEERDEGRALAAILAGCHQKTRNLVRKGLRQGFTVTISDKAEDWEAMLQHHQIGMKKIGGRAKTMTELNAIRTHIPHGRMRKLFVAEKDGEFAGALLNLYHRDWVEYFIPVAVEKFRSDQVLSAVIAYAMVSACREGFRRWNWGGTWTSQEGVYHFKKGWGAVDHPYRYFGIARDARITALAPDELMQIFPFFYARPFSTVS